MGCNSTPKQIKSEISENEVEEITIALTQLLKRGNSDAFVIFTEVNSGKFVQFAGSVNEDLYFSLPANQLNQNELSIAKEKLKEYNIHLSSSPMYTDETMEHSIMSLVIMASFLVLFANLFLNSYCKSRHVKKA